MKVLEIDEQNCSIQASHKDLAQLAKLLGWIVDSRSEMDEGRILLDHDQITQALRGWDSFIFTEIMTRAKALRK